MLMMNNKQKDNNKKKKYLAKKFLLVVSAITLSFCFIISILAISYVKKKNTTEQDLVQDDRIDESDDNQNDEKDVDEEDNGSKLEILNIMIFGVDQGKALSDVNMILRLNPRTNTIRLVSVPRDTYINLKEPRFAEWKVKNKIQSNALKLTQVHSRTGSIATIDLIETMFDVPIDYYVKLNLDGFKQIINTIGGIEIDVPRDMYHSDPEQDLYINLKKGVQVLNGEEAEQFVRYRDDIQADIGRIEMQQLLIKELAKKVLKERNLIVLTKLTYDVFQYVETDFPITKIPKYVPLAMKVDVDQINMQTLVGDGEKIRGYYILDENEGKKIMMEFMEIRVSD